MDQEYRKYNCDELVTLRKKLKQKYGSALCVNHYKKSVTQKYYTSWHDRNNIFDGITADVEGIANIKVKQGKYGYQYCIVVVYEMTTLTGEKR